MDTDNYVIQPGYTTWGCNLGIQLGDILPGYKQLGDTTWIYD